MKVKELKKILNLYNDDLNISFGKNVELEAYCYTECDVEIKANPTDDALEIIIK